MLQMQLNRIAPGSMNQSSNFNLFGGSVFRWIPVEVIKDADDQYNYRRILRLK